jgi:hypothetical protein
MSTFFRAELRVDRDDRDAPRAEALQTHLDAQRDRIALGQIDATVARRRFIDAHITTGKASFDFQIVAERA